MHASMNPKSHSFGWEGVGYDKHTRKTAHPRVADALSSLNRTNHSGFMFSLYTLPDVCVSQCTMHYVNEDVSG